MEADHMNGIVEPSAAEVHSDRDLSHVSPQEKVLWATRWLCDPGLRLEKSRRRMLLAALEVMRRKGTCLGLEMTFSYSRREWSEGAGVSEPTVKRELHKTGWLRENEWLVLKVPHK